MYVGPLGIRITHAQCVCFEACGREWFLSVWLSFFGSSSYFHFDSEIFITTKKAFVEEIKSACAVELEKRCVYFCGAAASKFEPIYFHAKVEALAKWCAWTRKSINAHRAPHLEYIMLCYFICIFFCWWWVCHMHALTQRIRGLMQLHVKGSRHHKLPTLFLFPHRVYKCIFSS